MDTLEVVVTSMVTPVAFLVVATKAEVVLIMDMVVAVIMVAVEASTVVEDLDFMVAMVEVMAVAVITAQVVMGHLQAVEATPREATITSTDLLQVDQMMLDASCSSAMYVAWPVMIHYLASLQYSLARFEGRLCPSRTYYSC